MSRKDHQERDAARCPVYDSDEEWAIIQEREAARPSGPPAALGMNPEGWTPEQMEILRGLEQQVHYEREKSRASSSKVLKDLEQKVKGLEQQVRQQQVHYESEKLNWQKLSSQMQKANQEKLRCQEHQISEMIRHLQHLEEEKMERTSAETPVEPEDGEVEAGPGISCPKCAGTNMKWRTNHEDGVRFLGCASFPKCRGTMDRRKLKEDKKKAYEDAEMKVEKVKCPECQTTDVRRGANGFGSWQKCQNENCKQKFDYVSCTKS